MKNLLDGMYGETRYRMNNIGNDQELAEARKDIGCPDYLPGKKQGAKYPVCMYFGTVTRRDNPEQKAKKLEGYCSKHEFMCQVYFAAKIMALIEKIKKGQNEGS